ncbi:MAG: sugar transferase [Betaproteobacteria bacterium]|nr:MAG: sugar transferase [Betaproteobacteria bacterium]
MRRRRPRGCSRASTIQASRRPSRSPANSFPDRAVKRLIDVLLSAVGLLASSPVLVPVMLLVWWRDRHSPFYVAPRVGRQGAPFLMVKLRSMVVNADRTGVDSTGANDARITPVGHFIRRYKLDELTQLWNVLRGDMSLVGPRPNVKRETDLYTPIERRLLEVRPGVTDFSSIVFSDEGDILKDQVDPDIAYNQLIRPGKSLLGLFYLEHRSLGLDLQLIALTAVAIVSRRRALRGVQRILAQLGAERRLLEIAERAKPLEPMPPPGATKLVTSRDGNPFA